MGNLRKSLGMSERQKFEADFIIQLKTSVSPYKSDAIRFPGPRPLTHFHARPSITNMTTENQPALPEQVLSQLEAQLAELISTCNHLKAENDSLRDENDKLHEERGLLMSNRDKVRTQVEAMISRLKALENG